MAYIQVDETGYRLGRATRRLGARIMTDAQAVVKNPWTVPVAVSTLVGLVSLSTAAFALNGRLVVTEAQAAQVPAIVRNDLIQDARIQRLEELLLQGRAAREEATREAAKNRELIFNAISELTREVAVMNNRLQSLEREPAR